MLRIILIDIKRNLRFILISSLLFAAAGLLNIWYSSDYIFPWTSRPGALSLFLIGIDFSVTNLLYYIVMFLILYPGVVHFATELFTGLSSSFAVRVGGLKRYHTERFFSGIILALISIAVGCMLLWVACICINPYPSVRVWYVQYLTHHRELYNHSMLLYSVSTIGNLMLSAIAYTSFGFGISVWFSGKFIRTIFPVLIYILSELLHYSFGEIIPALYYTPYKVFIWGSAPIAEHLGDCSAIFGFGVTLYCLGIKRIYTGAVSGW